MPELSHTDPGSTALLVIDYQVYALTSFMTAAQSADVIARVPNLIATARDAGMMVIHVVAAFRPGHPEVSPRNSLFSWLKANGMAVAGSEGAAIHPAAAAREGEPTTSSTVLPGHPTQAARSTLIPTTGGATAPRRRHRKADSPSTRHSTRRRTR